MSAPRSAWTNRNRIYTDGFSNPASYRLYKLDWPDEPTTLALYQAGRQCGGCSYFAPFNADWGLCCHPRSRHRLETVFEHFTCPVHVEGGWESHSFDEEAGRPRPEEARPRKERRPTLRKRKPPATRRASTFTDEW